jgi:hypothetical protein
VVADQQDGDVVGEAVAAELLDVAKESVEAGAVEVGGAGVGGEVVEQAVLAEPVRVGPGTAARLDQAVGIEEQRPGARQGHGGTGPGTAEAERWAAGQQAVLTDPVAAGMDGQPRVADGRGREQTGLQPGGERGEELVVPAEEPPRLAVGEGESHAVAGHRQGWSIRGCLCLENTRRVAGWCSRRRRGSVR